MPKGKGWHGETERHRQAALRGRTPKEKILTKVEVLKDLEKMILSEEEYALAILGQEKPLSYKDYIKNERKRLGLDFKIDSAVQECVSAGFEKYKGDKEFEDKSQDQKLGFLYGVCRQKLAKDMGFELIPLITDVIIEGIIEIITPHSDFIPFSEFRQLKTDFETQDFVIFRGPIARSGPYKYIDEKTGREITLYKTPENLQDIYSRYDYLPMKTSEKSGAHYAEELGYGTNFSYNPNTEEIECDLVLVNDDHFKEIIKKGNAYHVSPGYNDIVKGNIQLITDLDHIALSLGNEMGRACTGVNSKGASCTKVKPILINHDQNQTKEVIYN